MIRIAVFEHAPRLVRGITGNEEGQIEEHTDWHSKHQGSIFHIPADRVPRTPLFH